MTKKSNNTFNLSVADRTKSNIILSLRVKSISGVGFLFFCILKLYTNESFNCPEP